MPMNPSNFPNPTPTGGASTSGGAADSANERSTSKVAQSAHEAAAKVKSAATDTAHRAAETAQAMAAEKKDEAAERVDSYGRAIHESAKSLEEQDPNVAWLTHRAADRLQSLANYVRERDYQALRADAEDFARRHPAAFFGGACVAGFILGSVLKASGRKLAESSGESDSFETGYDPDRQQRGEESMADAPSAPAAMI